MVEVMKIMETSFKSSHAVPPTLQQATTDPCLHQRLLDTHGQLLVSLWWGHCSLFLGPGTNKVLFVPSKSLFPHSCVSSGSSVVGLMATSSKRAYATPRSMLKEISLEYSLEGLMLKLKLKLWPPNAKN